jgi:hypothetical protein
MSWLLLLCVALQNSYIQHKGKRPALQKTYTRCITCVHIHQKEPRHNHLKINLKLILHYSQNAKYSNVTIYNLMHLMMAC